MLDVNRIRNDFPMLKNKSKKGYDIIYLDNAATTFKPQAVIDTVVDYYTKYSVNAHRGDYELSFQVDTQYESTRDSVAHFIHADRKEIVFTSGASESLNWIAYGYGQKKLKKGDIVLSSEAEHASNILPWMKACEVTGATLDYIPLSEEGRITINAVREKMNENVKVIALAHITNVLGYLVPIKEIASLAHEFGAIVVVDGAQSIPHMPIDVKALDCDFYAFSAHKLCGPTGVGVMYGKYDLLQDMEPFMLGGGSNARFDMCGNILLKDAPYKYESGTPAIEAVLGMKAAIHYLEKIGMQNIHEYELSLKEYMLTKLKALDNVILYNDHNDSGIVTFNIKDVFSQDAATFFSDHGISLRSGQHCAKLLMDKLNTSSTLRASLYFYNTREEIDRFIEVCAKINKDTMLDVFF